MVYDEETGGVAFDCHKLVLDTWVRGRKGVRSKRFLHFGKLVYIMLAPTKGLENNSVYLSVWAIDLEREREERVRAVGGFNMTKS